MSYALIIKRYTNVLFTYIHTYIQQGTSSVTILRREKCMRYSVGSVRIFLPFADRRVRHRSLGM